MFLSLNVDFPDLLELLSYSCNLLEITNYSSNKFLLLEPSHICSMHGQTMACGAL